MEQVRKKDRDNTKLTASIGLCIANQLIVLISVIVIIHTHTHTTNFGMPFLLYIHS